MKVWMIRGDAGSLYDEFRDRSIAAIGWVQIAEKAKPGVTRQQLADAYRAAEPSFPPGRIVAGASQVWRFVNEMVIGDTVITYSPANRTYLVGKISGPAVFKADWAADGMALSRQVQWQPKEVSRDDLDLATRNSLGSTLTVFLLSDQAARNLLSVAAGNVQAPVEPIHAPGNDADEVIDPLVGIESIALERTKDLVSRLDWDEMQDLIAGILRAMGYKTQVSPAGADRGKDIIASPDGFGFESPRIVVEVKHRSGQMGSVAIRSFLGGRHKDDRGLYVSTGGFTKDASYEAERASIPLTLWSLDHVARALVEHYEKTDAETKRLVPLKRMYIPA